jgi:hypothetical protein
MISVDDLSAKIRPLLLRDWDPIGVADEPRAQDEYDAYAPKVARMIADGTAASDVAAYLLSIERDRMGLPGDAGRAARVARQLLALA